MSEVLPQFVNEANEDDFLSAIEKIMADGQIEGEEIMSASRDLANNPRAAASIRSQIQSFLNAFQEDPTMLSSIMAEEQEELTKLKNTPAPKRNVPRMGGAANVAKAANASAIARRDEAIAKKEGMIESMSALNKALGGAKGVKSEKGPSAPVGEPSAASAPASAPASESMKAPEPEVDAEAAEARGRMLDEMEPVVARDQKRKRRAERKAAKAAEAAADEVDVSGAAKAVPVDDAQAMDLFKTVHGGDFDPKSSMDKTKLAQIKENLTKDEYKGLTPNQFALRMYREAA